MTQRRPPQIIEPASISEIAPGDLSGLGSFEEWATRERLRTFLPAWAAQAEHERTLRGRCAWMIFALALLQSVGAFALIIGIGRGWLLIDPGVLKILFSALLAEIFGLFVIVVRYLFSQPIKYTFDALREGAE